MAFGNVIPIDADVARQLARRKVRFRWLVAVLCTAWVAVLVPTLLFTPLPPMGMFLVLAVLVVLAEHRFVLFGDETSMSASIIVIVASIFIFADTSPLAGPMLIASLGGLYLPHIRSRAMAKSAFNGAGMGMSAWSASVLAHGAFVLGGFERSPLDHLATIAAATITYWIANNLIVAGHQATLCGESYLRSARFLTASETDVLMWAGAAGLGVTLTQGAPSAGVAIAAGVAGVRVASQTAQWMLARNRFIHDAATDALAIWLGALAITATREPDTATVVATGAAIVLVLPRHVSHSNRLIALGLPLIALAAVQSGQVAMTSALLLSLFLLVRSRARGGNWTASLAIGTLLSGGMLLSGIAGSDTDPATLAVAGVMAPAIAVCVFAAHTFLSSEHVDLWTAIGLAAPSGHEALALVAVAGVSAAGLRFPLSVLIVLTGVLLLRSVRLPNARQTQVGASR